MKNLKWIVQTLTMLALTLPSAHAGLTASESPETAPRNQVVGSLPYSNQWVYDQRQSYLYLTFNHGALANSLFLTQHFSSDFGNKNFDYPSIDYFVSMFNFAGAESTSVLRKFSLWTRYGIGFGTRRGELQSPDFTVASSSESAYLTALTFKVGPLISIDLGDWIQPYAGVEFSPFFFRHSSSLDGAESQGAGVLYGPVAGLHFPIFFSHRASLYTEVRRNIVLSDDKNVFGSSTTMGAGLGMVF